jgi:glycosyltransferase involved in cell wall biosynthesis
MEKIDILLATYNGSKYLHEQLDSILSQSYENINVIIRDDGSSDNTVMIIEEYEKKDSRVRLLSDNLGNLGFVRNFEELMKNSTSEYLMFSDQDDIWYNNKVETSYKRIKAIEEKNGKSCPILVHTNSKIMNYETRTKSLFISDCAKKSSFENSFFNFFVQGSTMLINGSLKREALPFSKEVYLHDRYLHLIAEFIGIRSYIDVPTMDYRQHSNNEIGSRGTNIIKRLISNRYFNQNDKILFYYLHNHYKNSVEDYKIEKLNIFFRIINSDTSRFKRMYWCLKNEIPMSFKKKIFLIIKG